MVLSRRATFALSAGSVALLAAAAPAGVITSRAVFDAFPRTTFTFNADGAGTPITLNAGADLLMPTATYTAQGLTFSPAVRWVNDDGTDFDAAQTIGGSPQVAIAPFVGAGAFNLNFSGTVRSAGIFIIWNNTAQAPTAPTLRAFAAGNVLLETVQLSPANRAGAIGVADYGFLGLFNASPIVRLEITGASAIYDDLIISPEIVPAPGTAPIGLLGIALLAARRRRVG